MLLTECGFDPDEVTLREPDRPAWSSAIQLFMLAQEKGVSKLSFTDYLEIREKEAP